MEKQPTLTPEQLEGIALHNKRRTELVNEVKKDWELKEKEKREKYERGKNKKG
jgi:hypothetical protein